jgi:hypothetical protein
MPKLFAQSRVVGLGLGGAVGSGGLAGHAGGERLLQGGDGGRLVLAGLLLVTFNKTRGLGIRWGAWRVYCVSSNSGVCCLSSNSEGSGRRGE